MQMSYTITNIIDIDKYALLQQNMAKEQKFDAFDQRPL